MPRRVVPGMTVMVTRRTLRRTHLLRPDPRINAVFTYLLAVLAERHGVLVHAAVLMSTHEHIVLTDTRGVLPRFLQELHRLLALSVKVLRKWEGAVWDHEKTSVVELLTDQAIVEKIAYVMANPVAAGLVDRAHQWPGVTTRPDDLGRACWTAKRPDLYLDTNNVAWPVNATMQLTVPPAFSSSEDDLRSRVAAELLTLERLASADVKARGFRVLGAKCIRAMSPFKRARSWEPLRSRNPTFAVGRGLRDAFFEAVAALRQFRAAYRAAMDAWRRGVRSAPFPYGTYFMSLFHGATTARPF
jgi:putative transposase